MRPLQAERQHVGIVAGEDQQHAGRRLARASRVDRSDARMRMRRAQHIGARLTDELDVVDIAAGASHQIRVFLPRHRLANSEIAHRRVSHHSRATMDAGVAYRGQISRHCNRGSRAATRRHPDTRMHAERIRAKVMLDQTRCAYRCAKANSGAAMRTVLIPAERSCGSRCADACAAWGEHTRRCARRGLLPGQDADGDRRLCAGRRRRCHGARHHAASRALHSRPSQHRRAEHGRRGRHRVGQSSRPARRARWPDFGGARALLVHRSDRQTARASPSIPSS